MAKPRDYRAEYRRRIANASARGLSRSQARGHAKATESPARAATIKAAPDPKLEAALRRLRDGASLESAARTERISRERLRRFLEALGGARFEKRRWIIDDARLRRIQIASAGKMRVITVKTYAEAARAGRHAHDVGRFLVSNDIAFLAPHRGQGVTDTKGRFHPFETDPNALYRLASAELPAFHEIYEIVQ